MRPFAYDVINRILDMFRCDDDVPMHVDRSDDPMVSPQARRYLRFSEGRTTAQGLNDRVYRPKHRRPSAMAPVEVTTWN